MAGNNTADFDCCESMAPAPEGSARDTLQQESADLRAGTRAPLSRERAGNGSRQPESLSFPCDIYPDGPPPQPAQLERNTADGSVVNHDARTGHVTYTRDGAGNVRTFGYDENGEVNQVVRSDGTFNRGKNGVWTCDEDPKYRWEGKVTVAKDGTYTYSDKNKTVTHSMDGTKKLEHTGGGVALFDKKGELVEFKPPDGGTWKRNPDGTINFKGRRNGESFDRNLAGTLTCEQDGTVKIEHNNKRASLSYKPDGSEIEKVDIGGQQRVVAIQDANGKHYNFRYDQNGEIDQVKREDGTYTRDENNVWTKVNPDRTPNKNYRWEGKVSVSDDGAYSYTDAKTNVTTVKRTDGTSQVQRPDGDVEFNKHGDVISFKRKDGTTFEQKPDGLYIKDKNGSERLMNSRMLVTQDGTVSYEIGQTKVWMLPNGVELESEFIKGRAKVTSITNENGDEFKFKYDASGKVMEFSNRNGTITRGNDGLWSRKDAQGRPDPEFKWRGEVVAHLNGDHEFIDSNGASGKYHKSDGTIQSRNAKTKRSA